jgi:RNA polymerase sigma-B factor
VNARQEERLQQLQQTAVDPDLFRKAQSGDMSAREALVERYLPLARSAARRYFHTRAERDDLVQVASYGLVKAIDSFDPSRGFAFPTFAIPTMSGELKRHFRTSGWTVHVPRQLQELSLRVESAIDDLEASHGRSPSPAEIADYLQIETEEVIEALDVGSSREGFPLEVRDDEGENEGRERIELGVVDSGYETVDSLVAIAPEYNKLPERNREILRLRFGEDLTQREIAAKLGISQMHVSRLIRQSLDQIERSAAA